MCKKTLLLQNINSARNLSHVSPGFGCMFVRLFVFSMDFSLVFDPAPLPVLPAPGPDPGPRPRAPGPGPGPGPGAKGRGWRARGRAAGPGVGGPGPPSGAGGRAGGKGKARPGHLGAGQPAACPGCGLECDFIFEVLDFSLSNTARRKSPKPGPGRAAGRETSHGPGPRTSARPANQPQALPPN